MMRLAAIGCVTGLLLACEPPAEQGGVAALEAALEGTRSIDEQHGAGAEPPPLANAGAHRMTSRFTFTLGVGTPDYRRISIERVIDRGLGGAYRIRDLRGWSDSALPVKGYDEGRDILYDGSRLFIRRLGAPWAERETVGGHPERLLDDAYAVSRSIQAAFDHAIVWGPVQDTPPALDGADVSWYQVAKRPDAKPPQLVTGSLKGDRDHVEHWTRWWGATHRVDEVEGKMARLGGSDHWVAGNLRIQGEATVEGTKTGFQLRYSVSVEPRPSNVSFDAPEDAQPPTRPRTWRMIEDVLKDDLREVYKP